MEDGEGEGESVSVCECGSWGGVDGGDEGVVFSLKWRGGLVMVEMYWVVVG